MRKTRFTRVEMKILAALLENGGAYKSLYRLAVEYELNYSHAHYCVYQLAQAGWVRVARPGRDMVLTLAGYQG